MCFGTSQADSSRYLAPATYESNKADQRVLDRLVSQGPDEVYAPNIRDLQNLTRDEALLLGRNTDRLEQELDPNVYATRQTLAKQINDDLSGGGELPAAIQREAIKAGLLQALGSGIGGTGSSAGQATVANVLGREVINQRDKNQAKAAAFLQANPKPIAGIDPGDLVNLELAKGQNYVGARNLYKQGNTQAQVQANDRGSQRWQQNLAATIQESINNANALNQTSANTMKFYTDLAQAVATAAKPSPGCWVARAVYGNSNPKWLMFRTWLVGEAPSWFRRFYLKYGQRFAAWIQNKPRIKTFIRIWMDSRIQQSQG